MAKHDLHRQAVEMRKRGMSYSQIKQQLGISKGSLSAWLQDYPLTPERLQELRTPSEQRIERTRQAKARKRTARFESVRARVSNELGALSGRDLLLGGLFLYWGEGTKTNASTISVANTDPAVLACCIRWLELHGVSKENIRFKLYLYSDMDIEKESQYWAEQLKLDRSCFRKPYIKKSKRKDISYSQRFTHGTGNVIYGSQELWEQIMASLEHIRSQFAAPENA